METIDQMIIARLEKTVSRLEDEVKTLHTINAELTKKVEVQAKEIATLKAENQRLKNRKNSNNSSVPLLLGLLLTDHQRMLNK